ncbi:MAG: DNA topoisomerase IB [Pseudomonadota bacterium]
MAWQAIENRALRAAGLDRIDRDDLSIRRARCGRGFRYLQGEQPVRRPKTLARLKTLAAPPAWSDVRYASRRNAHLQCIGIDTRGRAQYIYHPRWETVRNAVKRARLKRFGRALPRIRDAVAAELAAPTSARTLAAAAAVRLIDLTQIRIGNETYLARDGTHGASTLRPRHVECRAGKIFLRFIGKGGKHIEAEAQDRALARWIDRFAETGGGRLFDIALDGETVRLTAEDVNAFVGAHGGRGISAKDFRTFAASSMAIAGLAVAPPPESERGRGRMLNSVARTIVAQLNNTPAVVRASYIHPDIIEAWTKGELRPGLVKGRRRRGLDRDETALMRFLSAHKVTPA